MDTNNIKNSQTYEFPPSPYGTYFELKTNHFQLEEATRSGSFDMKYRHYHSTYEIYYLLEGSRYYFIDRNSFFIQPGSLVFIGKNRIHKTSPAEQHFHHRFLIEIEEAVMEHWFGEMADRRLSTLFTDEMSILTLTASEQTILNAKLNEIKEEAKAQKELYQEMIEYLLREMLLFSFRIKSKTMLREFHLLLFKGLRQKRSAQSTNPKGSRISAHKPTSHYRDCTLSWI